MPALLGGTGIIGKDIFVKMKAQKSASIQTASGTVVTFPQSAEMAFSGLIIYGHSTQDGTPSPENPVPIVSAGDSGEINVTVSGKNLLDTTKGSLTVGKPYVSNGRTYLLNADGTVDITTQDATSATSSVYLNNGPIYLPYGKYTVSGNDTSITTNVQIVDSEDTNVRRISVNTGESKTFEIDSGEHIKYIWMYGKAGTEINGKVSAQIEIGTVATAYEPYKTPQTLTLSTPGGLPGIPVTSGGNYTDENGQQWICDEIDLKRGKYVQRVEKVELDGTEAFELVQGIESGQPFFMLRNSINSGQSTLNGYSNYFPIVSITIRGKEQGIGGWGTDLYLRWTELFSAVEDLKSFLSEQYTSGNPVRVLYILATPIETDLPAEEIAAYQALRTYSPTTTVSNDAEAWMEVGYNEFSKRTF